MSGSTAYDVIIIGGGLAGLSSAILLSRRKYKVLVIEKESYPKHKVCGEYISMESKPFLLHLGMPVDELSLPVINKLQLTDSRGNELNEDLPQGGFGISRYKLDALLAGLATDAGADLLLKTKADSVQFADGVFTVNVGSTKYVANVVCGAWGKRGSIDVKWNRAFIREKNNALNNYVGVKYHIRYEWPHDLVGLHNFTDGYCGISEIEDGKCCLCYLTTAASLQKQGSLKALEHNVLARNPWLGRIFSTAEFLYENPVTISQISFDKKEQVYDHVLLLGDAAGMITPLCGNGMSMALHASKIADEYIGMFLSGSISRSDMERQYTQAWKANFSKRITLGRLVQSNFGKDYTTSFFIRTMKLLPFLRRTLIKDTAGKPF